ncbi:MAG TPA: hypothetical protein VGG42_04565 [Acidobacteriaceae bacterium]|jgi:hypothetical protein
MKSILRAVALSGMLAVGAAAAQAQIRFGVRVGVAPVAVAVPPCPGVGYIWTPGYYYGSVWVPGRWMFGGYGAGPYVGAYGTHYGRVDVRRYDRDDYRDFDRDRGRDVRGHDDFHRR